MRSHSERRVECRFGRWSVEIPAQMSMAEVTYSALDRLMNSLHWGYCKWMELGYMSIPAPMMLEEPPYRLP